MEISQSIISALAALFGAVAGGLLSYFTARYTIGRQQRHVFLMSEITKRELLYADFIAEVSKVLVHAIEKKSSDLTQLSRLLGLQAQIRILSSADVEQAATELCSRTLSSFSSDEKRKSEGEKTGEARTRFTDVARAELEALKKQIS